jgi:hypothetical protein
MIAEALGDRLDLEAGELERLGQAAAVEDEPLAAVAPRVEPGDRRRDQRERAADRVEQQQVAAADGSHRLQRSKRVA